MKFGKGMVLVYLLTALAVLGGAYWGSRTVTVWSQNESMDARRCIVIDAGHGGVDGGAVSCTGRPESGYNLEISLRLQDLMHLMGLQTKMIRTEDISVYTKGDTIAQKKASDLKQRVSLVNETENGILISIHQNQFSDSRYSGAQVFYAKTPGSQALAEIIQDAYGQILSKGKNRQVKKISGVYLMERIQCPGVLIECGFLSNPQEEEKLRSASYQKALCSIIASAVSQYLSNT